METVSKAARSFSIMKKVQQGFTLIELMIVVAIIGILAAIAIPAYQDYTVRAKVSEPMTFLDAAKVSVAEFYQSRGTMPTGIGTAGIATATSQYIQSVAYAPVGTNGADITVAIRALGGSTVAGQTIVLNGTGTANGTVNWICTGGSVIAKYRPASCR
jgi:type IV pilus assembly protein PilA